MKKMLLMLFGMLFLLSSCSIPVEEDTSAKSTMTETSTEMSTETTETTETTVTTEMSNKGENFWDRYGDIQENPTNLELYMESDRYSLDIKTISFDVVNLDNRNFLMDWTVSFEYYDDGEWLKLSYKDPAYAENNNKSGQFLVLKQPEGKFAKSRESIRLDDYDFTFVAGKYRIVKVVGEITLIGEFELY